MTNSLNRLRRVVGLHPTELKPYVCHGCESRFDVQYHVCPVCGGFSVEYAAEPGIIP